MKILVAPNALKGSLTAVRAAEVIADSLPTSWEALLCPIADGGDGTLDCLVAASGGHCHSELVMGPLAPLQVHARWGDLGDRRTAVIEMAEASGLRLLRPEQYSVTQTTTLGVGELMLKALNAGFSKILVGLGGSATNDGGFGCAEAMGARFLDAKGRRLQPGGVHLQQLSRIDTTELDTRLLTSEIVCLSDVNCALTGPTGTSKIYARQKGATDDEIELLESALSHYAEVVSNQLHVDVKKIPCGAAGGLAAGLIAFCNARIVLGSDYILNILRFDEMLAQCDAVITAEGRVDEQTAQGKGIAAIAARANRLHKPVHVFAGRIEGDSESLIRQLGVHSIHQISPESLTQGEAMRRVEEFLSIGVRSVTIRM